LAGRSVLQQFGHQQALSEQVGQRHVRGSEHPPEADLPSNPRKSQKKALSAMARALSQVTYDRRKSRKFHRKNSNLENCVQLVLLVGFRLPDALPSLKFALVIPMRLS
ncbi:MAG: hypothetical protein ACLGJA_24720, partial [Gammaproteobacteria bacterium]